MEVILPNLPDSMAETTKDCSSNDDILAIFSNIGADLRSLGPSSPVLSNDQKVIILSPPNFPIYLINLASIDERDSFNSASTKEATWPFSKMIHLSVRD